MSQQSGSGQSCSEDSTESQSGSTSKPKSDFGKKHRKLVRILTVIAYIISVSTAAVLLSAYYVFLWKPATSSSATESPTTLAMARYSHTLSPSSSHGSLRYNSFALPASQYVDKHASSFKTRKSMYHYGKTNYPQIPTPQGLVQHYEDSTTPLPASQTSSQGTPQIDPTNKTNDGTKAPISEIMNVLSPSKRV